MQTWNDLNNFLFISAVFVAGAIAMDTRAAERLGSNPCYRITWNLKITARKLVELM